MNITAIPTSELFAVCSTLEASYEEENLAQARSRLASWGISLQEGLDELERREAIAEALGETTEETTKEVFIAEAIVRIRELFEAAPALAESDKPLIGLIRYRDLRAIQVYAAQQFNLDPWHTIDTAPPDQHLIVAQAGTKLRCEAVYRGQAWRHPHCEDVICFAPTHWAYMPRLEETPE